MKPALKPVGLRRLVIFPCRIGKGWYHVSGAMKSRTDERRCLNLKFRAKTPVLAFRGTVVSGAKAGAGAARFTRLETCNARADRAVMLAS